MKQLLSPVSASTVGEWLPGMLCLEGPMPSGMNGVIYCPLWVQVPESTFTKHLPRPKHSAKLGRGGGGGSSRDPCSIILYEMQEEKHKYKSKKLQKGKYETK